MNQADVPMVYFNPKAVEHKKLESISEDTVFEAFDCPALRVFSDSAALVRELKKMDWKNANLLWMTSGNFDGVDEKALALQIARIQENCK